MTFDQLKFFIEVYEQKSFSYAAETLSISQSSLSKQIKSLELEIGNLLFDTKSKRNFIITEAGHDFYNHAKILLKQYEAMMESMKKYLSLEKGDVSIASIPVRDQFGIIPKLTKFIKDYPNINISFMEEDGDAIVNEIHNNKIDLGILYDTPKLDTIADRFILGQDEFVAVVPKDHPLGNKGEISLEDLRYDQFILLEAGSDLYYGVLELCKKSGFSPLVRFQNSRTTTIVRMIEEMGFVSILLRKIVEPMVNDNIKVLSLKETIKLKLVLAVPKAMAVKPATVKLKNYMLDNK